MEAKRTSRSVSGADFAGNKPKNKSEEVRERWKQLIESLYDKDGKPKVENLHVEEEKKLKEDEIEPSILICEILLAISEPKKGNDQVMSVDAIPAEMLKSKREREKDTDMASCVVWI